ncbi:MAG: FAD-dependent oxidoreductase, partial [Amphiplicatus sp.]
MTKYDYDLFTIGAGSGGVRASRLAAMYGAKVGVAEEYRVGGTCVIRGCVPKKLLVYASEFGHAFEEAKGYGWSAGDVSFDWPTLIRNKDDEIDRLNGIYIRNLKNAGADIFESRAVLKDAHTVHLVKENRDVTADKILIATGGAPWTDETVEGHELAVTSNEAFHLEKMPKHVVIAGGGYIAVEFACIFRGLGAEVCLVYRGEDILRYFDRDISVQVHAELKRLGIRVIT